MATEATPVKNLRAPVPDQSALTNKERIILLQSAKLHGCLFPPWTVEPSLAEFAELFEDDTDLRLSQAQADVLEGWTRLAASQLGGYGAQQPRLDLVQDVTNDCSVVASLCLLSARAERMAAPDSARIFPAMFLGNSAPSGKIVFKLHFNGCDRKVVIDDRLPKSKTERSLHVFDRQQPDILWPALIEKAYLKVRGGYDFMGSTSGMDLWVLCGWVPEQVFLHDDDLDLPAMWTKVLNAFRYGDVLVTIGTGKMSADEQEAFGLAEEHAYAVLDLDEKDGRRRMLIKNPWVDAKAWSKTSDEAVSGPSDSQLVTREGPGVFWMGLNDVLQYFETMHLSWNPGLFRHRIDRHFTWDLQQRSGPGAFTHNSQYALASEQGGTVWLLLNKHFESRQAPANNPSRPSAASPEFIGLSLFETAHRVALTDGALARTALIDAHHVLLRAELRPGARYVLVAAEQDTRAAAPRFTLAAFSVHPLMHLAPAAEELPHLVAAVAGAWTPASAGGNASSATYARNPQYALTLPRPTPLLLTLATPDPRRAVHAKLLWAGAGARLEAGLAAARDVLADTGPYRGGACAARVPAVPAGRYTLVASAFAPGVCGPFTLAVRAAVPGCTLTYLPPADAGRLVLRLPPVVFRGAGGADRVLAPIVVARVTRLRVRARSGGSPSAVTEVGAAAGSGPEVRLALEHGQGPNMRLLAASGGSEDGGGGSGGGGFGDAARGVATPDVDLSPALCDPRRGPGVWLVVERAGGGGSGSDDGGYHGAACDGSATAGHPPLEVEVLATERGATVGAWGRASEERIEEVRRRLEGGLGLGE